MNQKVLKIGTSLGITIPKQAAESLRLRAGDSIRVDFSPENNLLTVRPKLENSKGSVRRARIARLTSDFIERYRADLEALAHK